MTRFIKILAVIFAVFTVVDLAIKSKNQSGIALAKGNGTGRDGAGGP